MKAATGDDEIQYMLDRISIHAAREGGDLLYFDCFLHSWLFQSTPPVKAATSSRVRSTVSYIISIHAAREGGDPVIIHISLKFFISIHAAREGGD